MSEVIDSAKKRYAAVGTGGRITMFIDPLARDYNEYGTLVGLCDASLTRATYHQQRLQKEYGCSQVPVYHADDFDKMIREGKPDVVIVCTTDATHHEYIIRALQHGCDVVTEKPLTTDAEKCREIFKAVEESGHHVRVSFNYRWSPGVSKVRELIATGVIGDVKAVNMEYQLNTSHGADYFRRWHSEKSTSGGLLVHKSTHHFDLINWWIDAIPETVFAWGDLKFYGKENAIARGEEHRTQYDRYTGTEAAADDPFALTLEGASLENLYRNAEEESGYIRDRNVFREGIDIEDTMALLVKYRTGVVLNYSLVAYSPREGFRVTFTGDKGRIEYVEMHSSHIIRGQSDEELAAEQSEGGGHSMNLQVFPHFKPGYEVPIVMAKGGHGGGDPMIQEQIFSPNPPEETLGRNAGHEQGAASILIGVAGNESMKSGLPVQLNDLCPVRLEAKHLSELI
jgi:predicted dehydrogenase